MTFDDARLALDLLEKRFTPADVVLRSVVTAANPTKRTYMVSVDISSPATLGEVARLRELEDELEEAEVECRALMTGIADGGIRIILS